MISLLALLFWVPSSHSLVALGLGVGLIFLTFLQAIGLMIVVGAVGAIIGGILGARSSWKSMYMADYTVRVKVWQRNTSSSQFACDKAKKQWYLFQVNWCRRGQAIGLVCIAPWRATAGNLTITTKLLNRELPRKHSTRLLSNQTSTTKNTNKKALAIKSPFVSLPVVWSFDWYVYIVQLGFLRAWR